MNPWRRWAALPHGVHARIFFQQTNFRRPTARDLVTSPLESGGRQRPTCKCKQTQLFSNRPWDAVAIPVATTSPGSEFEDLFSVHICVPPGGGQKSGTFRSRTVGLARLSARRIRQLFF
jgi:hypothetical protein